MALGARDAAAVVGKGAAAVALGCTFLVIATLAVRGPNNWSHAFGTTWYVLLVAADVSGLMGLISAAAGRWPSRRSRVLAAVVSLLPLLMSGAIALVIIAAINAGVTE